MASRRLHLHFWSKPVEVVRDDQGRVAGLKIERTAPDGVGGVIDTGEFEVVPVQSLYRAIGYFGSPLDEIPFDEERGVIRNRQGRVIGVDGAPVRGVFATGWISTAPSGIGRIRRALPPGGAVKVANSRIEAVASPSEARGIGCRRTAQSSPRALHND